MGTEKNNVDSWYGMGCCNENLEKCVEESLEYRRHAYNIAVVSYQAAAAQGHIKSQEKASFMMVRHGPKVLPKHFVTGISYAQMALNNGSEWANTFLNERAEKEWSQICFHCYAVAKGGENRFHQCAKCQIAHYCSKKCQHDDWKQGQVLPGHKNFCGKNKVPPYTK